MEVAANRQESVDDMAAPAIAPMPTTKMAVGVRCRRMMGSTIAASPRSYGEGTPYEVRFQSETEEQAATCCLAKMVSFHALWFSLFTVI